MNFVYLTTSSREFGLGHFSRGLSLQRECDKNNIKLEIIVLGDLEQYELASLINHSDAKGQKFLNIKNKEEFNYIKQIYDAGCYLIDIPIKFDYKKWPLLPLKPNSKFIGIDILSPFRLYCDICLYPPLNYLKKLSWYGYRGKIYSGWQFYILPPELKHLTIPKFKRYKIAIICGGSDRNLLTNRILNVLESFSQKAKIAVINGPLSKPSNYNQKNVTDFCDPTNLHSILIKSEIVICTYGSTLFELNYLECKVVCICTESDHLDSSKMFKNPNIEFLDLNDINAQLTEKISLLNQKPGSIKVNNYNVINDEIVRILQNI